MDNQCIFFSYIVKGEPKFFKSSKGVAVIQFSASSIRPNKAGLWNKNFFSAFGATAENLEHLIQQNTVLDIVAEQQSYEKGDVIMQNYLVKDFTVKRDRKPKANSIEDAGEEIAIEESVDDAETEETAEVPSNTFSDYEKMMAEFS